MSDELQLNIKLEDLMDPITLDWLEDPISLPCCGRAISRESLKTLQSELLSDLCPLCRKHMNGFNALNAPKAINLSYLVEQVIATNVPKPQIKPLESLKWTAKIHRLSNNNGINQTVIGRLELLTLDKTYKFKTLLIPVIDCSGSMSGQPTVQVKYSLNRIVDLIHSNSHLITNFVTYDDSYKIIEFNNIESSQLENHKQIVANIPSGGGTSFNSAFTGIVKVIEKFKHDPLISSITIIFLTDGEDCVAKKERINNVQNFKLMIDNLWNKKYTIHSVGFGTSHDSDFLNALRIIGTEEGAYRYADPSENSDILSSKINSLLDVVAQSSAIPIKLIQTESSPPIISGSNDKYWLNLTKINPLEAPTFAISVDQGDNIIIQSEYVDDENEPAIWDLWCTYLVDEIATEILKLSTNENTLSDFTNSLDKQIHCELLEQRSRAILAKIDSSSSNFSRLQSLVDTIKMLKSGEKINTLKLNDLRFEGQFKTKILNDTSSTSNTLSGLIYYGFNTISQSYKKWDILPHKHIKRCNSKSTSPMYLQVLGKYNTKDACKWIEDNLQKIKSEEYLTTNSTANDDFKNMLLMASKLGKCNIVKTLLNIDSSNINITDSNGYNSLDLSIIYGYWHTAEILFKNGAKPTVDREMLLRTCLSNSYFNTSSFMVKNNLVIITDDMMDNAPTAEIVTWLSGANQKEISLELAITKGIYDKVEEKILADTNNISKVSWKEFQNIFSNPTSEHYRIVELLLKTNKADPDEEIEIIDEDIKGITWPLFIVCEKGQYSMFKLLTKYSKKSINKQNHKGTTCLWIASCNRHSDIVAELLNIGSDPNLANIKGDSPLIPACQKGNDTIVEMLLESGACLDIYNKNRDNPILICCRTGQHKILDKLLKTLDSNKLNTILYTWAEIDGFIPLLAAAELDKTECIKLCIKYGTNIETRANDDNKMIPGGTALHLACYYGRTNSVKLLVELGADLSSKTTIDQFTPLHYAIKNGHLDLVRYLLTIPKIKEIINIEDASGKTPAFYAKQQGNESMYEQFFVNKLAIYLGKLLYVEDDVGKKCNEVLVKYGQSLGCYEYSDITNINVSDGSTILTYALLTNNDNFVKTLINMGADLNKKDDFGISPLFWIHYLNKTQYLTIEDTHDINVKNNLCTKSSNHYELNSETNFENNKIIQMLDKVKNMGKINLQNKLLTTISNIPIIPEISDLQTLDKPTNTLIKMSDGYGFNIKESVLSSLKGAIFMDHSLSGFIDKLKSKKEFPDGENVLNYLIWDAKINLIKRIATNESKLQPVHLLSLYLYTSNEYIFKQVNKTLLNWKIDSVWNNFIQCLYQSVSLIEVVECELYRAVDFLFNMEDFAIGKKLSWNTFSSTSKSWKTCSDLINKKSGIIFIIKSKTGRDISKYSKNPVDGEVLFLPNTKFLITNHFSPSITCLAQENIRLTTYKIKDKDYERACQSTASIIIELVEITENI
jgi:ankyrin repeat protein